MMTVQQFINQASAQKQDVSQINADVLTPEQMQQHLDGICICCGNTATEAEGIWDYDCSIDSHMIGHQIGYANHIFCTGCEDNLPIEVLLKYGAISQHVHNVMLGIVDNDDDLPF